MDRRRPEPGAQLHDYIASPLLPTVTLKQPCLRRVAQLDFLGTRPGFSPLSQLARSVE